jgi:phospholipid-transporting ATPase
MWRDVKIGDVLKVQENEAIPADLIILKTDKDNICYVETKNLDGETNLKHKAAPLETVELAESLYKNITIESELPSDKIYSFKGVIKFTG